MDSIYSTFAKIGLYGSRGIAYVVSVISAIVAGYGIYLIVTNPANCNKGINYKHDYRYYGTALVTGSVFFTGLAWLNYYVNSKSKVLSAVDGASLLYDFS